MKRTARPDLSQVTASILVGGLGTRLRPVVSDRPKALAPVHGKPFLSHLLDRLEQYGIRKVVLCTGHQGGQVSAEYGDAYGPMRLFYSQEAEPLGTAGALRLALPLLDTNPVLVMNGDSYCNADLDDFFGWHTARHARASLLLTEAEDTRRYGRVCVDSTGRVLSFEEKGQAGGVGWINAGVYLLEKSLLESITREGAVSLEREILPAAIGHGLFGWQAPCRFLDIGTPEAYSVAERFFSENKPR